MTRWVYPPCPGNPVLLVWVFLVVAPAPFCVVLLFFLLAKRKSGREICESSLFCLVCVWVWICLELWNQGVSQCLLFIYPLLSLLGPSLRAKSAATEEKKMLFWFCFVFCQHGDGLPWSSFSTAPCGPSSHQDG